jgi:hypothetical protein
LILPETKKIAYNPEEIKKGMEAMKRALSISKKILIMGISIIMILGFFPINAAAADPVSGINLTAVKDPAGVTATLSNSTSASVSASLVFAIYEPNGKLGYIKQYPVTAGANSSAVQRFDFDFSTLTDYIIKLFAWDGTGFIPLSNEMSSCLSITIDGSGVVYDGIGINVIANTGVADFKFVMLDEFTKRGAVYSALKAGKIWAHSKMDGVDVIIAYKPADFIGSALPDIEVSDLRMPNGVNKVRVLVSQ